MAVVAILAIGLFWAASGKQDLVPDANPPAEAGSVRAPIALMDKGLTPDAIGYWKLEPEANSTGADDELEPIIITAPRYRPELESDKPAAGTR